MGLSEGLTVALPKCIFRAAENDDPVCVSVSVSTSGNASLSPTVWPNVFASASVGLPASVSTSGLVYVLLSVSGCAFASVSDTVSTSASAYISTSVSPGVSVTASVSVSARKSTNAQAFSSLTGWRNGSFSAFISVSASVSTSFSASILSMCHKCLCLLFCKRVRHRVDECFGFYIDQCCKASRLSSLLAWHLESRPVSRPLHCACVAK